MPEFIRKFGPGVISGKNKSLPATMTRTVARLIEPFYTAVMAARNQCYNRGIFKTHSLGKPTISIGNITTGGTGKTPVVAWLAGQLRKSGHHPAVLLRGYGAGNLSDEAQVLERNLNSTPKSPVRVHANPSRIDGARQVLAADSTVDLFLLDDAFQHRKAARHFDLLLISATQPFGYNHVLPRGLLRESLDGLKRADAFLITRASLVEPPELARTQTYLRDHHPTTPLFKCDHTLRQIWNPLLDQLTPIQAGAAAPVFLVAGIGDPDAFAQQIIELGFNLAGQRWFSDHHEYTTGEVIDFLKAATDSNAVTILTTEKDWVKIKHVLPPTNGLNIGVVKLEISFAGDDEQKLLELIARSIPPVK